MIKKYIYLKKIHIPQLLEEGSKTKHSAEGYRKRDTTTPLHLIANPTKGVEDNDK